MADSDLPTAAQRFRIALDLFDLGERMLRQKLRRVRPDVTEEEADAVVAQWLGERRGAENGDADGCLVPWPRPRR